MKGSLEAAVSREDHRTTILKALQEKLELRVLHKNQHGSHSCELNQVVSEVVFTTNEVRVMKVNRNLFSDWPTQSNLHKAVYFPIMVFIL